jgi:putative oxidoreductase
MFFPPTWFHKNSDIGVLLLRLFTGIRLLYGVLDNVVSWSHMLKFRDFLQQFQFPFPLLSAILSVYCQLLAGILFVVGFKIRMAAILMIVNFLVAVCVVHWGQPLEAMTPPLFILFVSILFLFQGAGRYSVDQVMNNRKTAGRPHYPGIAGPG